MLVSTLPFDLGGEPFSPTVGSGDSLRCLDEVLSRFGEDENADIEGTVECRTNIDFDNDPLLPLCCCCLPLDLDLVNDICFGLSNRTLLSSNGLGAND